MPWLRVSDTAISHPRMLRVLNGGETSSSLLAEAFGFLTLGATLSAAHMTDYVVEFGSWVMAAGGNVQRARELLQKLEDAGLVKAVTIDGHLAWEIWQDEDFLHMRSKDEVEIDRQRKRDMRNPDVALAARVRDGDQCRYCGRTVSWTDRKSARSATYDHIDGVKGDATANDVVVCCRACNTNLRAMSGTEKRKILRSAPEAPYFSQSSANYLNSTSWVRDHGVVVKASRMRPEVSPALHGRANHSVRGEETSPVEATSGVVAETVQDSPECPKATANRLEEHSSNTVIKVPGIGTPVEPLPSVSGEADESLASDSPASPGAGVSVVVPRRRRRRRKRGRG